MLMPARDVTDEAPQQAVGFPTLSIQMVKANRQILLASRPNGEPTLENFRQVEGEIQRPGPGQMLLRSIFLSLDPYMRGRMNAAKSYAPPVEIGQVREGRAIAEVVESNARLSRGTSFSLLWDGKIVRS
jgi:NADPH-dependent curcumin reductase CurA